MSNSKEFEKISFYEKDKRKADLKLKLHSDGLSQAAFFRGVAEAYVTSDGLFMEWFRRFREQNSKIQSKAKNAKTEKLEKKGEQVMSKFGISTTEVEDIFDLIEREYTDL